MFPHFIDGETEAQKIQIFYLKLYRLSKILFLCHVIFNLYLRALDFDETEKEKKVFRSLSLLSYYHRTLIS